MKNLDDKIENEEINAKMEIDVSLENYSTKWNKLDTDQKEANINENIP